MKENHIKIKKKKDKEKRIKKNKKHKMCEKQITNTDEYLKIHISTCKIFIQLILSMRI